MPRIALLNDLMYLQSLQLSVQGTKAEIDDDDITRKSLIDSYMSSGKRKLGQIIIFRDGASQSKFNQVLNIELDKIIEACKCHDEEGISKDAVIQANNKNNDDDIIRKFLIDFYTNSGKGKPDQSIIFRDRVSELVQPGFEHWVG
ncbi:hypothetical protein IEQ34_001531 [Dendrobium chrysotoxum]|uniref:Piwi domain-containing protein n=1 Tax=Dendrobium chrysotoxum TaxID=161865 RepID=A0AAV7HQU8_DENCH|nr:hypothetical protein IEQ34_001531 [Dendrobium chrysotoxum]